MVEPPRAAQQPDHLRHDRWDDEIVTTVGFIDAVGAIIRCL